MSDPIVKSLKRSPSRPASRQSSVPSPVKSRTLTGKTARLKPIVKRSTADKAPARKAKKENMVALSKGKATKKQAKAAPTRNSGLTKSAVSAKGKAASPKDATSAKRSKKQATSAQKTQTTQPKAAKAPAVRKPPAAATSSPPPRQTTYDEAAALRAFEQAHKGFAQGHFAEARTLFRALVEKHASVSEVTARARTYLAIAEARLRTESTLPRDADSLYDRGVIELNRGEYVAAQELFERALKREPEAAHIHYGLAATRARLGSIDTALESLRRALDLQPNLRIRAQHDQDLTALRNDPDFERLVFPPRF